MGVTVALVVVILAGGVAVGLGMRHSPAPSSPISSLPQGELRRVRSNRAGLRVLFIGNSFTAANGLVALTTGLVDHAPGRPLPVFAAEYDPGGYTLSEDATDPQVLSLLSQVRWNVVVLQEQSQAPEFDGELQNETGPAAVKPAALARRSGARPLLFETWGYEFGDLMNFASDDFSAMQRRLQLGYRYLGQLINRRLPGSSWNLTAIAPGLM